MSRTSHRALALIAFALCTGTQAQDIPVNDPPTSLGSKQAAGGGKHPFSGLALGAGVSHATYSEPGLMQTQGPRLGVWAALPLAQRGQWQPRLQGQLHSSAMQYSSPISGELPNVPDHEIDLRLTVLRPLGQAFETPWGPAQADAFGGLGYRWHFNDLRGSTSAGHVGYRRVNQRIYTPLGLQLRSQSSHALTASIEWRAALHGVHTTHMTDIGASSDATVSQQSEGWSVRVSWQPWPAWTLAAYHSQWNTQDTGTWSSSIRGVTQRFLEPASQWRDTGIQLIRVY